ncbi:hypothetical protein MKZ38_009907 [Zalerion maritima]|uniref:Uncharacterized protein n=1 Tax=Zalerion maritima TaxID=339359 RepID=A0AAD5WUS9_9PEZI|nr:hypothetical protein MKZ38_009907 [Zalerion maritima]
MYSWYMPKDSPSSGLGHRHEWENVVVVVFLDAFSDDAGVVGMAVSQHGWLRHQRGHRRGRRRALGQPLVAWESMSDVVKAALEDTDFGDATVPFKESTFLGNLGSAAL